ncbi:unnamed protein product, partial [Mycena citricolor]
SSATRNRVLLETHVNQQGRNSPAIFHQLIRDSWTYRRLLSRFRKVSLSTREKRLWMRPLNSKRTLLSWADVWTGPCSV